MRSLMIAAALVALPAAAQAQVHPDSPIAESLPSPEAIDRGAAALGRAVDGLMQVDVGPVVDAIDPSRGRAGERTLGDFGRRSDPYFEEHVQQSIGALADGLILLRSRMHSLEPALRRSLGELARSFEDVARDFDEEYRGGPYDRGY